MAIEFFSAASTRVDFASGDMACAGRSGNTLMAWVYPKTLTVAEHTIIGQSNGAAAGSSRAKLGVNAAVAGFGRIRGNGRSADTDANQDRYGLPGMVPLTTWTHIAAVFSYTNKTITTYANGILDQAMAVPAWTATSTYASGSRSFSVGSQHGGGSEYFDGYIDDARVYGRALSADEIRCIAEARGTDGIVNDLWHRYLFEEGPSGTLVPITSGIIKDTMRGYTNNGTPAASSPRWLSSRTVYCGTIS